MTTTDTTALTIGAPRSLTLTEFLAEGEALFGPDKRTWAFQCPTCGGIATGADFPRGLGHLAAVECLGRHGVEGRCKRVAYGLFPGPWMVGDPEGMPVASFPFAAPSQAPQGAAQNPAATPGPASPPDAPDAAVRPACALCGPGDHPEAPWHHIEAAPRDGTEIIGLFGDEEWEIRWAEERRCMLAESYRGTPGIGLFDAGWEQAVEGLAITDEPDAWRPADTAAVPLPSEPYLTSDED